MGDDSSHGEEQDEEAADTKASSEDDVLNERVGSRAGSEERDKDEEDEDGGREAEVGGREDEEGGMEETGQDDELADERELKTREETGDRCNAETETDHEGESRSACEEAVSKMNGSTKKDGANKDVGVHEEQDLLSGGKHGTSVRNV